MKNTLLVLLFLVPNIVLTAQQSEGWETRPANVDTGITNNSKSQIVISEVPSYIWHHGCGPTALGMVVGYYDSHKYSDLIDGDAYTQTSNVNNAIAGNEHYNDYSLPLDYSNVNDNPLQDKSEFGGAHSSNCLADFMRTSWSSRNNYYGWSYSSDVDNSFINYAAYKNPNYQITADYEYYSLTSWNVYKTEIDNNRPVVLLVDSDGDGSTDHFVCGIGYDESQYSYAIYDTWDNNIHWYQWREMSASYSWGIYGFNKFEIYDPTFLDNINQEKTLTITPNPAKYYIDINTKEIIDYINIYSISGKIEIKTNKKDIDISALESGIYIINIKTNKNSYNQKFIKI